MNKPLEEVRKRKNMEKVKNHYVLHYHGKFVLFIEKRRMREAFLTLCDAHLNIKWIFSYFCCEIE